MTGPDFRRLANVDPEKDGVDPARVKHLLWESDLIQKMGDSLSLDWTINIGVLPKYLRDSGMDIETHVKLIKRYYDKAKGGR